MGKELFIEMADVKICSDVYGNPNDPAILLIMGASASMLWWDEEFCKELVNKGYFVIRYDNRDTGKSTTYEVGNPPYSVIDMVNDAKNILDYFKIKKAHIVGLSLGGMIAQLLTIMYNDYVLSLTIIASSVWDDIPSLPAVDQKIIDFHRKGRSVDWSNENEAVKFMTDGLALLNGSKHPFNYDKGYELSLNEYRRANNIQSMFNHARLQGGEEYYGHSKFIKTPTLIIHGTEDPVLPYEHAVELNKTISTSKLITLDGRGHEFHFKDWALIADAIHEHIINI